MLYAVGQGALAVECRESDVNTILLLKPLYDPKCAIRVITERSFLRKLGGGCSAPVAVTTNLVPFETRKFKMSVKGAVWSLDGKDEIIEADTAVIEIKDCKRCAMCPFGFKSYESNLLDANNKSSCSENNCTKTDIECLKQCSFKRQIEENGNSKKKAKVEESHTEVPSEILKNDPHEHCPMKLPIGIDFMGKCPYLDPDTNLVNIYPKSPSLFGHPQNLKEGDYKKCPFLRQSLLKTSNNNNKEEPSTSENTKENTVQSLKLYVGLVPHEDVPEWALNEAQNTGTRLAEKLMKLGATEIMTKAQNYIRSS